MKFDYVHSVEAVQYDGFDSIKSMLDLFRDDPSKLKKIAATESCVILSLEDKEMDFSVGDWLVKHPDGEFRIMDNVEFTSTFRASPIAVQRPKDDKKPIPRKPIVFREDM